MTQKTQSYDHPAYEVVLQQQAATTTLLGASAAGIKYCAFTNLIIKAFTGWITTGGTSADVVSIVKISGTTTTTQAYGTTGSGVTGVVSLTPTNTANQVTTLQGDLYYAQKGTDATGTYTACTLEYVVQPNAPFTV
ncbi:MAG: hypothetical protein HRJ53_14265 [Acidobacteria bacterium Pan2503]|uniref:Uncharacterized protein n=1 Tax=Candidatus Acidiferrum panamense TaxID=2741543 RepID=A0A7V8NRG8_9BACT|nr:hypothetical protein [Candidatus Acidoferrum panamensis]